MKKHLRTLCFSLSFCSLMSCEGYKYSEGTVVDSDTGHPLDSVLVVVTSGSQNVFTDSTGFFSVQNDLAPCTGGCKDIIVEFSKEGYQTKCLMNEASNGRIELSN